MKDQNNSAIQNCELVEVRINNASQNRFNFPDMPGVRGKRITAIQVFKTTDATVSPSGKNILGTGHAAAFTDGYVTLHSEGKEKIKEIPLAAFHTGTNNGLMKNFSKMVNDKGILKEQPGIIVDPMKSFVSFSQTTNLTVDEVVMFVFYYLD